MYLKGIMGHFFYLRGSMFNKLKDKGRLVAWS